MEKWLSIKGYENLYEVSSEGRVRSLHNRFKTKSDILKPSIGSRGYLLVTLCKDKKQTSFNIHKLVANAFLPNPNNYPCINHKDEVRTNNSVSNLEWCSYQYNNTYGNRLAKASSKRSCRVMCVETGIVYKSQAQAAAETQAQQAHISDCCRGKRKSVNNLHFCYAD